MQTLKQRWKADETTLGGWLSIPSSITAEATARSGFDYVCIDMQHGVVDYSDVPAMIQAILLADNCPIVRVPWNEPGVIGKVLDAGAHGVIIPMVNTVAEAEAAVRACRYAPDGARSSGPILALPRVEGGDYLEWARENVVCIPMIETVEAVGNVDAILAVPGIDAIYVGPADLSITLGLAPGNNDHEDAFTGALVTIIDACRKAGVVAGIHSTGDLTPKRVAAGFSMVTVTSDGVAMRLGLVAELAKARSTVVGESKSASSIY